MKSVSGREFGKALERKGWTLLRIVGSHHHYGRGTERVIVPVHANRTLKIGLQSDLMKHAGLTEDDL